MMTSFIHLHVHSEFSLMDGLVLIDSLLEACVKEKMPAVALTDQSNLFGMVKFYKATLAKGIKPIIGAQVWLANPYEASEPFSLVLLCKDQIGYKNLTRLLTRGYLEGQVLGRAILQKEWLEGMTQGLIALSGGVEGDIGQALLANKKQEAQTMLQTWMRWFPNAFYLELTRTNRAHEEHYIQLALDLAEKYGVPVVATNDVRFLNEEDFDAHEARVCIHDGYVLQDSKRPHRYAQAQYLKTPQEMIALFEDIPEAITNTLEIAKRCNLMLTLGKNFLPDFDVPTGMTMETYLVALSEKGLEERLVILFPDKKILAIKKPIYDDRLKIELQVIGQMGFAGYFLIVADFIQWSKNKGIPVGPGRGSGAGSLVAYTLKITDLDPLEYDLLFERFLNPERVSMPDFDIDFCMEGRDRVIEYVAQKYGRMSVSQIITFGTMAAKAVVRDVGRVLNHPYGFVDKIAKLIPFEIGMTLEKALTDEPLLKERYEQDEEVHALIDLALKLEGVARNAGKHAGGVVISPGLLTDFTPLYCEEGTQHYVTQFDKDDVEAIGLVKFDFLGLRTLTIIDWAVQAINRTRAEKKEAPLDITLIPTNDAASYSLLKSCQTTAVFQLESRGMKDLIKRLQPDCFEDIIALVALFRPGPLQSGMVDDFINRKHGRTRVIYPHPSLEPVLKPTYGVIVYQEQVMQIAQILAGYSLGAADILRRAMGKKKAEEMAEQRQIFIMGAKKNNVSEQIAASIFDLMEKFAGYGFNKSHSAAYALVAYQTAWMKAHYPAEFMAAVLSSDMDNTDKIVVFIEEAQAMKLNLLPPSVNAGEYPFSVNEQGNIIYGLGAIKGVGEAALSNSISERNKNGPYKSLFDFCCRVDARKVTKRVLEALVKSGAFDVFGMTRASLWAALPKVVQAAEQHGRNKMHNQVDLFSDEDTHDSNQLEPQQIHLEEWSVGVKLQYEKETLGYYLSGHPFDEFETEIRAFVPTKMATLADHVGGQTWLAGLVMGVRTMKTKRGQTIAFLTLDDHSGRVDVALFSEVFESSRELVQKGGVLIIEGEVANDDYTGGIRVSAKRVLTIESARALFAKRICLELNSEKIAQEKLDNLKLLLEKYGGGNGLIQINYHHPAAKVKFILPKPWQVNINNELIENLKVMFLKEALRVEY